MAYINPQYQIDMQQDQRANQNYSAIGNSIVGAIQENRQRALEAKRLQDAQGVQDLGFAKDGQSPEAIKAFRETGDTSQLASGYKALKEASLKTEAEKRDLDRRVKESTINKNNRVTNTPKMGEKDKIDYRFQLEQEKKQEEINRRNNIPDFEIQDGVELTPKDRETLTTQNGNAKNIQAVGQRLIEGIDKNGITSGLGFTKADRDASQGISEMQLQLKELFNLGAITGPDMDLINANMGKLQGPIDMLNPFNSRDNAKDQIKQIIGSAIQRVSGTAAAKGATYLPAQQQATAQVPQQVIQKVATYSPAQKEARLAELRNKKAASMQGQR